MKYTEPRETVREDILGTTMEQYSLRVHYLYHKLAVKKL